MTRPNRPAYATVSDGALFGPEAAGYARYRPGLPGAEVHLLAATQHGVPAPVLLDLGTGTGQVPRALRPVLRRMTHIDLVDVNASMLEAARAVLEPIRGACTVEVFTGAAHTFAPAAPGRAPTLISCCRSFHWMARPEVLAMADRVAAPHCRMVFRWPGRDVVLPRPVERPVADVVAEGE
ncbi:methyltransferase family protein [Streptomyces sp. BK022]|uniref:class I SAM-dependent methyltransferase n=1 Tax=Streptomyces sp. BK022 TaxID=2512123 RepID=UPI0010EE93B1|nr:class I SAM-dependent methyltransferase [Streptomyces sp. BK022]RZU46120.1 methyltransferase family protein [Streptomyces sp. BK022]